jgi:hypothetical protein
VDTQRSEADATVSAEHENHTHAATKLATQRPDARATASAEHENHTHAAAKPVAQPSAAKATASKEHEHRAAKPTHAAVKQVAQRPAAKATASKEHTDRAVVKTVAQPSAAKATASNEHEHRAAKTMHAAVKPVAQRSAAKAIASKGHEHRALKPTHTVVKPVARRSHSKATASKERDHRAAKTTKPVIQRFAAKATGSADHEQHTAAAIRWTKRGRFTAECGPVKKRHLSKWKLSLSQNPGVGMNPDSITPFETVFKDDFAYVKCAKDELLSVGDKFGNGKLNYKVEHTYNVSIIRYADMVPSEHQVLMSQKVCFQFCRTVPGMSFFGLVYGRDCYCAPFFPRCGGGQLRLRLAMQGRVSALPGHVWGSEQERPL